MVVAAVGVVGVVVAADQPLLLEEYNKYMFSFVADLVKNNVCV